MNATKLAHIHDPQVSHDAAANLSAKGSEAAMNLIVDLIDEHGPRTPKELVRDYQRGRFTHPDWPVIDPMSMAKRASEMKVHLGLLYGTKERRERAEALGLTIDPLTAKTRITDYWRKDAA